MSRSLPCMVAASVLFVAGPAISAQSSCADIVPRPDAAGRISRLIRAEDLITLRDIGPVANTDVRAPILSISPDGKSVAFQVRQADLAVNGYCFAMFVMPLVDGAKPVRVDSGGEFIRATYGAFGLAVYTPAGPMVTIIPKWSPDGLWIAYLRRDKGVTQVWRAKTDGSLAAPVTHLGFDAEDFAWSTDGSAIIVSGRPGFRQAAEGIDKEGQKGFLFDDRFVTASGSRPLPRDTIPTEVYAVDIGSGKTLRASAGEITLVTPTTEPGRPPTAGIYKTNTMGGAAWTAATDPDNVLAPVALYLMATNGSERVCKEAICNSISGLWWSDDGKSLIFLRSGWRTQTAELYRWDISELRPKLLWTADDVLIGCQPAGQSLICGHETSTQPRQLVSMNLKTGKMWPLFDPNPEFGALKLGQVTRLRWKNDLGIETWGDLVLPPEHKPGERHPLIVVQYESRGFLRGGTGDDYPIQLFAAHGYAVLSFQKPPSLAMIHGAPSWDDLNKADRQGWAERQGILSSLNRGIDAVIATGAVDPLKIGLTGLSDGASTAQFALVHSHRFAAIAMSTCCEELGNTAALIGPPGVAWFHRMGDPGLTDEHASEFWKPVSIVANAAQIDTPVLFQLADREYLSAIASVTALKERGKSVELYVFPDEYHIKWQPVHRQAIYQRDLDWFDFWLKGKEDFDPAKSEQYRRWNALKASSQSNMSASPGQ